MECAVGEAVRLAGGVENWVWGGGVKELMHGDFHCVLLADAGGIVIMFLVRRVLL